MAYYATARIFADPFGSFLEGQRAAYDDVRKQQELLRRMYETYLSEQRLGLGFAELDYKYDALKSLDQYRKESLGLQRKELELKEKQYNQPSSLESILKAYEELNKKKKDGQQVTPGTQGSTSAGGQSSVSFLTIPKKAEDRIPVEPSVAVPPTAPQPALPPINGAPQAALAAPRAVGGFTLSARAAQQLRQAPPTTPVPNPLAAHLGAKDRTKQLPAPVSPPTPSTGGFAPLSANRPPGGRKYVYDRIPTEAPQATAQRQTPAATAQNTEKVAASMERLLSLRQEIVKQLQNPNIDPKGKRALAAALTRVDSMLMEGRNAR